MTQPQPRVLYEKVQCTCNAEADHKAQWGSDARMWPSYGWQHYGQCPLALPLVEWMPVGRRWVPASPDGYMPEEEVLAP